MRRQINKSLKATVEVSTLIAFNLPVWEAMSIISNLFLPNFMVVKRTNGGFH
jgi:hypothetical protein